MEKKLSLCLVVLVYRALYPLPEGRSLNSFYAECEGSAEMLPAHFLTLDQFKSRIEGNLTPKILSEDLMVHCSLFLLCLVANPNQAVMEVMEVQRTDWIMAG